MDTEATRPGTMAAGTDPFTPPVTATIAGEPTTIVDPGAPHLPVPDTAAAVLPHVTVPDPAQQVVEPASTDPQPLLWPHDVVDDRYEVVGPIARGGLGWVHLARDLQLDGTYVALKGMIDPADAQVADAERRMLIALNHPNVVRISGFVTHPDPDTGEPHGYLVMEYVGGLSLGTLLKRLDAGEDPLGEPLRAEHVIGYGLEILRAMQYLHDEGLLYCDMKPDNVVHSGGGIKLIDLGATRSIHDDHERKIYITKKYQVPAEELNQRGLTVRSDVYTVGVTLEELLRASDDSEGFGIQSLRHVIARARAPFERRFQSAIDMRGHLAAVLREIESLRDGSPRQLPSASFAQTAALLDAGLGTVPALGRWTSGPARAYRTPLLHTGLPEPPEVALLLPPPRVDPRDDAAGFLAGIRAPDARRLLGQLSKADDTVEVELARCRTHLEDDSPGAAKERIDAAAALLREEAEHDWRIAWHRGVVSLAHSDVLDAHNRFEDVYRLLAGESAPKIALGYCAEWDGDADGAREFYEAVWLRDRDQAGAAFGLARLRLAGGDRAGAVEILDEVPDTSPHHYPARVAAVRVLAGKRRRALPSPEDLEKAEERLERIELDGDDARERLTLEIRETELAIALAAGDRARERAARARLEESFRTLTHQAVDPQDHGVLTDLANTVRPRTRF